MKTKIQFALLLSIFIFFNTSFGQKINVKSELEKNNLKQIQTYRYKQEKKESGTNFLRAKYDECYFYKMNVKPDSIAMSYLKKKYSELGISPDLEDIRIKKIQTTPGGKYVYFEQHINNIPVFSSSGLVAINKGDTVTYMINNFRIFNKNQKLS